MHGAPMPPVRRPQEHASFDAFDDQSAWSAPELFRECSTTSGGGGGSMARGHRRTPAMVNTALTRVNSRHMMSVKRRGGGGGGAGDGGSSSEDEDGDGFSGNGNGVAREGGRRPRVSSSRRRTSSRNRR